MLLFFAKETLSYRIKNGKVKEKNKFDLLHFDHMRTFDEYSLEIYVKGRECEYQLIISISSYHLDELHNSLVRD